MTSFDLAPSHWGHEAAAAYYRLVQLLQDAPVNSIFNIQKSTRLTPEEVNAIIVKLSFHRACRNKQVDILIRDKYSNPKRFTNIPLTPIYDLITQLREHPDFLFGTIFTTNDLVSKQTTDEFNQDDVEGYMSDVGADYLDSHTRPGCECNFNCTPETCDSNNHEENDR
jgi:hypothetical protein